MAHGFSRVRLMLGALASALTLPSVAAAECRWDFSGTWYLKQGNGIAVKMVMHQIGNDVWGTASYQGRHKVEQGVVKGAIDRRPASGFFVERNTLTLEIKWLYGETGVYSGGWESRTGYPGWEARYGYLSGMTHIKEDPGNKSRQTSWAREPNIPCR